MWCLHDPANVQQTSSKCIQNTRANAGRLLEVCWTFAGSCKHPTARFTFSFKLFIAPSSQLHVETRWIAYFIETYIWSWSCRRRWCRWKAGEDVLLSRAIRLFLSLVLCRTVAGRMWTVPIALHLRTDMSLVISYLLWTRAQSTNNQ